MFGIGIAIKKHVFFLQIDSVLVFSMTFHLCLLRAATRCVHHPRLVFGCLPSDLPSGFPSGHPFVLILVSLILPCCQLLCPLSIPFPANLSSLELHLSYLVIFLSLLVLSSSFPVLLSDGTFTFWRLKRTPLMVEIRVTRGQKGDTAMQVNI